MQASRLVGLVCHEGRLLGHGQLGVHQDPQVLCYPAAFQLGGHLLVLMPVPPHFSSLNLMRFLLAFFPSLLRARRVLAQRSRLSICTCCAENLPATLAIGLLSALPSCSASLSSRFPVTPLVPASLFFSSSHCLRETPNVQHWLCFSRVLPLHRWQPFLTPMLLLPSGSVTDLIFSIQ